MGIADALMCVGTFANNQEKTEETQKCMKTQAFETEMDITFVKNK